MNLTRKIVPIFVWLHISLSGCVTTDQASYSNKAAKKNALEQRLILARRYIGDNNWEDAKRNLQLAMEIKPNDPEVYEAYALFNQSTGEYDQAEQDFKQAIKLRANFSRARNNYAAFLYLRSRYEEAQAQLLIVTSDVLYSARPEAFVNLGMCQRNLNDRENAEQSFKKALLMDPDNLVALVELGHLAYDQGKVIEARRYFEASRNNDVRQSPRALWLGVIIARKQGDLDLEASLSLKLKSLYPDSIEYQRDRHDQ